MQLEILYSHYAQMAGQEFQNAAYECKGHLFC